jgi:hypothetical protein
MSVNDRSFDGIPCTCTEECLERENLTGERCLGTWGSTCGCSACGTKAADDYKETKMLDSDEGGRLSPNEKNCTVCGPRFKGYSEYCSTECWTQDRDARSRCVHDLWFRNSSNSAVCQDDQERKFYERLTQADRDLLHEMLIGV